jgi:uncharacterized membrane protein YphA (DoxX/SURF4 family)
MTLSAKLRRAPGRIVAGAFILNSGITKLKENDEEAAKTVHGFAAGAYPFLDKIPPKPFLKVLGVSETMLGSALLLPIVPPVLAGAGLMGFSGGLLGLWWRTPGMHEEGSPRPTQQGITIAKDVWMLGIGTGLVLDGALDPARNKRIELTTGARVATARRAAKAGSGAKLLRAKAETRAAKAQARAAKAARKASKRAAKPVYTAKGAATAAKDVTQKAFDIVTP